MLDLKRKQEIFRKVWRDVRDIYYEGFCITERGLQAALYMQLRKRLTRSCSIVVEPPWERKEWGSNGKMGKRCPDIVIVENSRITDIFELKWASNNKVKKPEEDLKKLREYVELDSDQGYQVSITPKFGTGDLSRNVHYVRLHEDHLLHFVAVSQPPDIAVGDLPGLDKNPRIIHWRGPVGDQEPEWEIRFDQRE